MGTGRVGTGGDRDRPRATHRVAAIGALLAAGAAAVLVVAILVTNILALVVALLGLALVACGAWWVLTETGRWRTGGWVTAATGVAAMVLAPLAAVDPFGVAIVRTAVLVLLVALAVNAARLALRTDVVGLEARARRTRPAHPVLLCNPWSGGGKVERFGLEALAAELGVETIRLDHGLDLEALARGAVARGADCLGMAGGDGSQALVASIAVEHDLPFVCVTAGTRNHFALDLGLDREDPRASMYAFRDAVERRVDFATVNGRFFVNNVSLGVYATIVQQEGYRDEKAGTTRALLPELLGRHQEPFDLQFTSPDGVEVDGAFLVQVSNNPYALGSPLEAGQRRSLDTGRLGVFAVAARNGTEAARMVTQAAVSRGRRASGWYDFVTETFEVRSRSGTVFAGIDGEALELATPLRIQIHPRGLRMFVPAGNLAAAERRRERDVDAATLFRIAAGQRA
jgi:diacylglycerol kinase family enzyme